MHYVSSVPDATASGRTLSWRLGTLAVGSRQELAVTVATRQAGSTTNCAEMIADQGLSDRDCAETATLAPQLVVEKQCPEEVSSAIQFTALARLETKQSVTYKVVTRAAASGDICSAVGMTSDQTEVPVTETESTHTY